MTARTTTAAGRRAAAAQMLDECAIVRKTGEVLDEDTATYVDEWATVYTGPCKVGDRGVQEQVADAGERLIFEQARVVSVPVDVVDVLNDDEVHVTAAQLDPMLVGARLVVRVAGKKSFATARRIICEEATT